MSQLKSVVGSSRLPSSQKGQPAGLALSRLCESFNQKTSRSFWSVLVQIQRLSISTDSMATAIPNACRRVGHSLSASAASRIVTPG